VHVPSNRIPFSAHLMLGLLCATKAMAQQQTEAPALALRPALTLMSAAASPTVPAAPAARTSPAGAAQALSLRQALQFALAENADISVSQSVAEAASGAAQQQAGTFDPTLTAQHVETRVVRPLRESERLQLLLGGFDLRYELSDSYVTQGALTRQFENGMQASVVATHTHLWDNTLSAVGVPRQNTGVLSFQLRVPLLRNAGDTASAPLRAAEAESEAARSELEFTTAQTLLGVALAYWDYLARTERLAISLSNEHRGEGLIEEMRKLIAADELPRADIQLAQASLNDKRSARIAAEQAQLESRRNLGRALGLDARAAMGIGNLADRFPAHEGQLVNTVGSARALAGRAVQSRADIVAARRREDAARIRVEAARGNERPQLDLVLSAAQSGLAERASAGALGAAFAQNFGPGYGAGVVYQMPFGNNSARGLMRQQLAAADAQRARLRELGYAIENNIEAAAYAVQRAAEQLREADGAVRTYAASLDNERTKRRLGMATLIDVLNVEDRYNNALLAAVQTRQNFAGAIARFRFEAGDMITRDGERYSARVDELFSPTVK